ncbi:Hexosyltransferase [Rhynchospora pubera]|uniref:Hexosyltransferase n=1 Tax=Rhynchospora pubera TaxID=906938 RepID=A0AAV8EWG5_9POAL|nr:Hexosyltransferase [Rhynchospora pubera]
MGLSPGSTEARHRTGGVFDDEAKRRTPKIKVLRGVEKFNIFISERSPNCKFGYLKFVLFAIICGAFFTFMYAPRQYHEHSPLPGHGFVDVRWVFDVNKLDPRYISSVSIQWDKISEVVANLGAKKQRNLAIGLLNFNMSEVNLWQALPNSKISVATVEHAKSSVTWDKLYPEWIDEEEEEQIPSCPSLPDPKFDLGLNFDVIAVKLPCNRSKHNWSRDVARLHLQLSAAKLAVASARKNSLVHVLFVTDCFPMPNLFGCKHLVKQEESVWLYEADVKSLKEKLRLPVGSCELAVPLKAKARLYSVDRHREAYATILHSADAYVCGAIAVAQSIRQAGSTRDLVILVDSAITPEHRAGLQSAGWKIRNIERIRNPKAAQNAYNEWNYSKFRLWQLTEYDKIIFIDADLLILRNIDFLFAMPEISATQNNATLFNSGVMVIEPCNCTFNLLMENINNIHSYNGGDQGYLNEVFTWWHRIPKHMNFLKHFWQGDREDVKAMKTQLFGSDPPVLYVLHYLGLKPWFCYRDYDCNWNVPYMHHFASDTAHARWWKVHDNMSRDLQRFCVLQTKQKAGLEWDRRQAEKENLSDEHWKRKITDPRLQLCYDKYCDWESMLSHWGEPYPSNSSPDPGKKS